MTVVKAFMIINCKHSNLSLTKFLAHRVELIMLLGNRPQRAKQVGRYMEENSSSFMFYLDSEILVDSAQGRKRTSGLMLSV